MAQVTLTVIGSGDAFGTGGRLNTCFHVSHSQGNFLIDCGASSLIGLHREKIDPNTIDTVFISHLHGDHFAGLIFLLMEARYINGRDRALTLVGPKGLEDRLEETMNALYPQCWTGKDDLIFPLTLIEWEEEKPVTLNDVTATPFAAHHLLDGNDFTIRLTVDGKTIIYSGDTGWTDTLIPATDGGDLFISECYFKAPGCDFHMDYDTLMANRDRLNVKEILLTHLGPDMFAQKETLPANFAYDGCKIDL